jgi:hypothetical protein
MAQHIGCAIVDEEGVILNHSEINFKVVFIFLWTVDPKNEKYPWLISIDDNGDTTFNWKQFPYLLSELKTIANDQNLKIPKEISELITYINSIDEPHFYLKFFGD